MIRLLAFLAVLAILGSACAEAESTIAYQYEVQGEGDNVAVTYLTDDLELIEERVSLPWTSDEFEGTPETPVRIEANGSEGSILTCVVRRRPIDDEYGADGSGESSQSDEDSAGCALDLEHISTES